MFSPEWLAALSGILLLDLLLSGDNAILIALACKNLPHEMRRKAIIVGGLGAVFVRIVCTLFATGLLASPYIEFIGGAALVFIAIKLVTDHSDGRVDDSGNHPTTFGQAVRTILIADFIMSIDNILSLAGVANTVPEGKWSLIICGLMISIPIVLFGAQIFLMIMLKGPRRLLRPLLTRAQSPLRRRRPAHRLHHQPPPRTAARRLKHIQDK